MRRGWSCCSELAAQGVTLEEMQRAIDEDRLVFLLLDRELSGEPVHGARGVEAGRHTARVPARRARGGRARAARPRREGLQRRGPGGRRDHRGAAVVGNPGRGAARDHARPGPQSLAGGRGDPLGRRRGVSRERHHRVRARAAQRRGGEQVPPEDGAAAPEHPAAAPARPGPQPGTSQEELAAGAARNTSHVYVGFADIVGFTRLGERVELGELGALGRPPDRAGAAAHQAAHEAREDDRRRGDVRLALRGSAARDRRWSWSSGSSRRERTFRSCAPASRPAWRSAARATGTGRP